MPFSYALEIQGGIPKSDIIVGLNNIENENEANVIMMISESRKNDYDEIQGDMRRVTEPLGLDDPSLLSLSPEELLVRKHLLWNRGLSWAVDKMEHEQLLSENVDERTLLLRQYFMRHPPIMTDDETLEVGKEYLRKVTDILQARGNVLELVDGKHRYKFIDRKQRQAELTLGPGKEKELVYTRVIGKPLKEKDLHVPERPGVIIY